MIRVSAALLLVLLGSPAAASAAPAAPPQEWLTDLPQAVRRAESGGKRILVDLYAEWCTWCRVLEKEVFQSEPFREFARDYVLLRVDTEDRGQGTSLYLRFGGVSLPTTLIIDTRLALVAAVEGYLPTPQFLRRVERELKRHDEYLARFASASLPGADRKMRRQAALEARQRADGARAVPLLEKLVAADKGGELETDLLQDLIDLADAYRIDRRFDEAVGAARRARTQAVAAKDHRLQERADILIASIAQERGDCPSAKLALETFLRDYPRSSFSGHAQRVLKAIAQDRSGRCA